MPSWEYVLRSLYGAWRLARLDKGGMALFDLTIEGFWRSFFAAVLVAPFHVVLLIIGYPAEPEVEAAEPGSILLVESLSYVLTWAAFPVIMILVVRLLSLGTRYVPFIIAYNWAAVIQMGVLFPVALIDATGALPAGLSGVLMMVAFIAVLFYAWFVTRTALGTAGLTAAGIVTIDVLLSLLIDVSGATLV